jgi:hypothetical protein
MTVEDNIKGCAGNVKLDQKRTAGETRNPAERIRTSENKEKHGDTSCQEEKEEEQK